MSDVTAEEVRAERSKAHALARSVYRCNDPHMNKQHSNHCDDIATALAVRAREARREALKEALMAVESIPEHSGACCEHLAKDEAAIRALLGPET
jgi:hypothetical protein